MILLLERYLPMKNDIRHYPMTLSLLLLTTIVFLVTNLGNVLLPGFDRIVYYTFGMIGQALRLDPSQLWRLVTPIFIHFGLEHFAFNAISLYFAGRIAEQLWGSTRFFFIYILSGILGNILCFYFTPLTLCAGASTSIFGIFAAIALAGLFENHLALKEVSRQFFILIAVNLVFNLIDAFSQNPSISLSGHIGGALGGALLGLAFPLRNLSSSIKPVLRVAAALAYIASIMIFFIFQL